jgi:hypothetical protein
MPTKRSAGAVLLAIGLCWLAVLPSFLWFMVALEMRPDPGDSGGPAWRLWRALEALLVEPWWLACLLAVFLLGTLVVGMTLAVVGLDAFRGGAWSARWAERAVLIGVAFCSLGWVVHRALLMPVVLRSPRSEVLGAAEDFQWAVPIAVGTGLATLIAAGLALLGAGPGKRASTT